MCGEAEAEVEDAASPKLAVCAGKDVNIHFTVSQRHEELFTIEEKGWDLEHGTRPGSSKLS